ncbi:MAG: hypothetical protein DRP08_01515 [Candidatus Aenigmatarchaeota archaeon]|nr:MAG: hypothetical protein DRP08_01515 [Candidatus Aenigmarchaeota archaeon]
MTLAHLEKAIARYVVFGTRIVPKCYEVVLYAVYPSEVAAIRDKVCPFCGRKFRTRQALYLHLNRSSSRLVYNTDVAFGRSHSMFTNTCYFHFQQMVRCVVELGTKVRNMIRFSGSKWVALVGNPHPRFKTREEAIKYLLVNGHV